MKLPKNRKKCKMSLFFLLSFISILLPSFTQKVHAASEVELLNSAWYLNGSNGSSEKYQTIDKDIIQGKSILRLTYNLNGVCILGGDASAIIFDQSNSWQYVSLSDYGKNCYDGIQTVDIPLSNFSGLNTSSPVGTFHSRFWYSKDFNVEILSAKLLGDQVAVVSTSSLVQSPQPVVNGFKGEYWNTPSVGLSPEIPNRAADLTRDDNSIDFSWSSNSPDTKINKDNFIARWTKTINFNAGSYRFVTNSDDGIRVWLDNDLLIDQWNDHSTKIDGADRQVSAGNHQIKIEYYENGGDAVAKMSYSLINSTNTPTVTPTPAQNTPPSSSSSWQIRSVSSMKESKDKICGQASQSFIDQWVGKAKELGVNYIAVETPYDNPSCGDSLAYTRAWVNSIRAHGLKVWHRHMYTAFEGIYNTPKRQDDYLSKMSDYIKNNSSLFAADDIFTPAPEPQNGGIAGFTGCDQGVCQFNSISHFNKWLRDAIDVSENAFNSIGLGRKMKIGYYGFDGFVTWGSNNPDWHGILEDATVQKMGNITIDHYPELIGQTMEQGLNELQAKYPNTPIIIGEWGSAGTSNVVDQVINSMSAAKRPNIIGFNYWHMGMGGNESLINDDFSNRPQFSAVQSFFK